MAENEQLNIVQKIRKKYGYTQKRLAELIGVSEKTVQNWEYGKAIPKTKHQILREMLDRDHPDETPLRPAEYYGGDPAGEKTILLPLVPIGAGAALPGDDQEGVTPADCEMYAVPEFTAVGAKYLIRVHGESMVPEYQDGDLLACRKIDELLFVQPGRIYVLDTNQGQLVKMIMEDKDHPDMLTCHSLNTERFADFQIPKSAIRSISIVVGVVSIRTE